MRKRFYLYGFILVLGVFLLLLVGLVTQPGNNFAALTQSSQVNPKQTIFKTQAGYLEFLPKAYVVVLYSGNETDFKPAEYIIVTRLNDDLTVELINGAGIENVKILKNLDAEAYLTNHSIDLTELNKELMKRN